MPLQKLQFRPGIIRDVPAYTNTGGWYDCNLVRFKNGFPQAIGGWQKYSNSQFNGACRDLITWVALNGTNYVGVGTTTKYYVEKGGNLDDITPLRDTVTLTGPFTATNGSTTLTVTDANHGCEVGDFVTFSGATGLGGNVTAAVLNKEYQVASVPTANTYTVVMSVTANASDSGTGGTVTARYQITTGLDTQVGGIGWGAGVWGGAEVPFSITTLGTDPIQTATSSNVSSPYDRTTLTITHSTHGLSNGDSIVISGATAVGGVAAEFINRAFDVFNVSANSYDIYAPTNATSSTTGGGSSVVVTAYKAAGNVGWGEAASVSVGSSLRLWSSDNFGQDLIFNVRNGGIYYWSPTYGSGARGVALNSLTTDPMCPTIGAVVRTSDQERHVIVFGGNNYLENDGVTISNAQDPLLIKWSSQEDYTVWSPSATNSAGDLRLGSGTKIVHAVETKREILVWTDAALYSMQYLGPPYTYGINQLAANITVLGFNSFANVEDIVYWMGNGKFYVYDGRTSELPCAILKHVFDNFNYEQSDKVFAGVNSKFNEVTWFYPTADSNENNVYVTYNYAERAWTYGTLARTAWVDSGTETYPIGAGVDGYLYNHELGTDDGSTNPFSPLPTHIESSPIEIESGDRFAFIRRIIPDVGFYNSTSSSPTVTMTLKTQNFPGANYQNTSNSPISQTATIPVEQFTDQAFVRLRGRQASIKISSNQVGTFWTLGTPRIEIQPDGKR